MIVHHVIVDADGAIRQQGHCHAKALGAIRVAPGCKLLVFRDKPEVKAATHRYDFATLSFSPIRMLQ